MRSDIEALKALEAIGLEARSEPRILLVEGDAILEHVVPPEPEPEDRRTLALRRIRTGLRAPIVR